MEFDISISVHFQLAIINLAVVFFAFSEY